MKEFLKWLKKFIERLYLIQKKKPKKIDRPSNSIFSASNEKKQEIHEKLIDIAIEEKQNIRIITKNFDNEIFEPLAHKISELSKAGVKIFILIYNHRSIMTPSALLIKACSNVQLIQAHNELPKKKLELLLDIFLVENFSVKMSVSPGSGNFETYFQYKPPGANNCITMFKLFRHTIVHNIGVGEIDWGSGLYQGVWDDS